MRALAGIALASASPRRAALLRSAGLDVRVVPSGIIETARPGEPPAEYVYRLAHEKVRDVAPRTSERFVVGADTVVVVDATILEKPADAGEAAGMLARLSGRAHDVLTGYEVYDRLSARGDGGVVATRVWFKALAPEEILAYVATGEPLDKAGAYAIQEGAGYMVERIAGSYTNVVGLPLAEVVAALVRCGAAGW